MNKTIDLYEAMLLLKTTDDCHKFFSDLCTPQELKMMKERWQVCQLLEEGNLSYREIHQLTKASLTTIGRVARFLKEESYRGYRMVLERKNRG